MGSCIGSCAGAICIGACCKGGQQDIRINHIVILFLGVALATILRFWGGEFVSYISLEDLGLCTDYVCYGFQAVYRISLALTMYFLTFAFLAHCVPNATAIIGSCIFQLCWIGMLLVGFWFIPDGFYNNVYSEVARFVAAFFLLFQIMVLVAWSNEHSDRLRDEERFNTMMGITVVTYGLALTGIILMYLWFGGDDEHSCSLQNTSISISLIMIIVTSVASVDPRVVGERGGRLMVSAVLAMYTVWMNYSGLSADPSACNTVGNDDSLFWVMVGLIWSAISVVYSAWTLGTSDTLNGSNDLNEKLVDEDGEGDESTKEAAPVKYTGTENMKTFFLVMAACSMYLSMLLTDWASAQNLDVAEARFSKRAMWVQLITQWTTYLLYIWVLIAPTLFPDRDFT